MNEVVIMNKLTNYVDVDVIFFSKIYFCIWFHYILRLLSCLYSMSKFHVGDVRSFSIHADYLLDHRSNKHSDFHINLIAWIITLILITWIILILLTLVISNSIIYILNSNC